MRSLRAAIWFAAFVLWPGIIIGPFQAGADEPETGGDRDSVAWVAEPDGYRMEQYRAPVPDSLSGGTVVSAEEVKSLMDRGGLVLIDVLPRPPKPKVLPEGTIWQPRPRHNIPGSVWLPNTGFGALAADTESYFRDNLERLTQGDKGRRLLFYCLADCWMSWNAAKRAISYGYSRVHWFPEGTDAWIAAGYPTEKSEPEPAWAPE
ncbi:MAG: PQQ-dependent catabolism-associated CXXCW motif protein [Rhodospirillales bacterium]|nr:PQQ-dependent catabolism-associated CXXCW motif protein [Rhodospirillales bacterium]